MVDFVYNGNKYRLVKDRKLFSCYNVLFAGYVYIDFRQYKKYIGSNDTFLVEV